MQNHNGHFWPKAAIRIPRFAPFERPLLGIADTHRRMWSVAKTQRLSEAWRVSTRRNAQEGEDGASNLLFLLGWYSITTSSNPGGR